MSVRFNGRLAFLLLIVPLAYFQCMPLATKAPRAANPKRYNPTIDVDKTKLTADPVVSVIWDRVPSNPNGDPPYTPSVNPVTIHWKGTTPFNLQVKWKTPNCPIEDPKCNGHGECVAKTKPPVSSNVRCTFEMLDGDQPAKTDDEADIIVMPCCS
jgi:hypothetical protein